jgi:hypothetical protein
VGRNPTVSFIVGERQHRIERTAGFKCAATLEILTFEKQLRANEPTEGGTGQHRGAVNVPADSRVGFNNRIEVDHEIR